MKMTIVLQSFRRHDVPEWMSRCLTSVREWAASSGFAYECLDDAFFDLAPAWVRTRCGPEIFPVTDIARLHYLQQMLAQGYQRVIWIDADVLIFKPEALRLQCQDGATFCEEWVSRVDEAGGLHIQPPGINNAVMVFEQNNPILPFYLHAAETRLRRLPPQAPISRTEIGPPLLHQLASVVPLACNQHIGLFNPWIMEAIAEPTPATSARLQHYLKQIGYPLYAANLSHYNRHYANAEQRERLDWVYDGAVGRMLDSQGGCVQVCII